MKADLVGRVRNCDPKKDPGEVYLLKEDAEYKPSVSKILSAQKPAEDVKRSYRKIL